MFIPSKFASQEFSTALQPRWITGPEDWLWVYQMFLLLLLPYDPPLGSDCISRLFSWFGDLLEDVFCLGLSQIQDLSKLQTEYSQIR